LPKAVSEFDERKDVVVSGMVLCVLPFHWFFLAHEADLPECLLAADPDAFIDRVLTTVNASVINFITHDLSPVCKIGERCNCSDVHEHLNRQVNLLLGLSHFCFTRIVRIESTFKCS